MLSVGTKIMSFRLPLVRAVENLNLNGWLSHSSLGRLYFPTQAPIRVCLSCSEVFVFHRSNIRFLKRCFFKLQTLASWKRLCMCNVESRIWIWPRKRSVFIRVCLINQDVNWLTHSFIQNDLAIRSNISVKSHNRSPKQFVVKEYNVLILLILLWWANTSMELLKLEVSLLSTSVSAWTSDRNS